MRVFLIAVLLVFLILPFSASATTYYVSRIDGNDNYNGLYPTYQGGSDGPWLTLAKSVDGVSSGDTVYLRGGTWQDEQLLVSLKNYNSTTTFKAYPGETPVIDMRNSGTTSSARAIRVDTSNNVRIEGITVRNVGNVAIYGTASQNFAIVNCTTEHSRLTGIHVTNSHDFDVSYNLVKYTQCPSASHDHDTWTSFSEECISIENSYNGNVHHNSVYKLIDSWGGEGINVKNGASYIYVYNNLVDHVLENGQESTRMCMGVDAWTKETHHIYFYNNILKNGGWGLIFNSEEGGYAHHLYAWNNIIIHCGHSNYQHGGGIGLPHWGGSPGTVEYGYWWNNIIHDCYYGAKFDKEEIASVEVRNNIFYNSTVADIQWGDSPQGVIVLDHNLFNTTDPKFVNASAGDFHLLPGSPAIDAGVALPNVTHDLDGIPRPQGEGYDIGAYEYVSVSDSKTYYVDSDIGNDSNNCSQALSPSTPKRTVNSVMSCDPGAGEIVKFRGTFMHDNSISHTIKPTQSGQVLYPFQAIQGVSGSVVTFNQPVSGLNPSTDYVTVYNSRKGNSGAFAVVNFSGNSVTVNASFLPSGSFITETTSDPGDLHAAILRPVHFTAWDKNDPPVWDVDLDNLPEWGPQAQTFHSFNKNVIMVSYLKTITDWAIWKAFEIDGNYNTSDPEHHSNYHIFDHLEVTNGVGAIGIEYHDFHTSYNIIQHNNFHDIGYNASGPDEIIYYGNAVNPGYEDKYKLKHDYVQIMYNKIGPHRVYKDGERLDNVFADGIEIKPSAHNATVWGNEVTGIQSNGCSDAPIKTDGTNTVISNNYIHDIAPLEEYGLKSCGISVIDGDPDNPERGASGSIISNNIIANVRGVGMWLLDVKDVKVLNNVIYKIPEDPHEGDLKRNAGIAVRTYLAPNTENIEIKNNIIQLVDNYGISAKIYSETTDNDYNLIFQTPNAFYNVDQGDHDLMTDPLFVNPSSGNFHLQSGSPAIDSGTDVGLTIDFDGNPITGIPDIGAFEYADCGPVEGDLNGDCSVTILDLAIIALDFGKRSGFDPRADTIVNSEIDIFDVVFVASRFS